MHIPRATSGLSVFFGTDATTARLLDLPVGSVTRNEAQPREHFDPDAIATLAESIAANGIIQPIAVREVTPESYEIIAGERRWLAAQRAGLSTVPAVVHVADDRRSLVLGLVENLVREDLNPLETARAYSRLVDQYDLTIVDLARALGKSRPAVANTLRLLELPDDVIALLEEGQLSEGHGRALLQARDRGTQRRLAREAVERSLSVRALESLVRDEHVDTNPTPRPQSQAAPELQARVERVAEAVFGVSGRVKLTTRGGRIELRCRNVNELLRLVEKLESLESLG